MKRKFLTAFLSMVLAMISVSCHSSEERIISFDDLPMHAQQFVNKHFAEVAVSHAEKEKDKSTGGSMMYCSATEPSWSLMRKASGLRLTASSL